MNKIITLIASLALMAFFAVSLISCEKSKDEQTAIQWAQNWLVMVDNGKYIESWDELAVLFKKNIKKAEWANDLNQSRKPLGKLLKRELEQETKSFEPSVGEYLIFQFKSSFENKNSVVEAVSVIKENNSRWGILGYSIM